QFSLEKANSVSAETPRPRQKSMHRWTPRAPARWPIIRGRRRRAAHRPLPSMLTARWRGRAIGRSYRHQFPFLGLDHLVDVLDALLGELLDPVGGAAVVVLGGLLLREQALYR